MPTPFNITDLALLITGSINVPDPTAPTGWKRIIIQRTTKGLGNIPTRHPYDYQVKTWRLQADPKTFTKQAHRKRFGAAVAAWHDATLAERETARKTATKKSITLFNAYLSDYIRAHPVLARSLWDAGATSWDNNYSHWDDTTPTQWDAALTTWDLQATAWKR